LGLALEALEVQWIEQCGGGQDLQRHVPPQRFLLGFVNDSHPATANLAQDAVIAQTLGPLAFGSEDGPRKTTRPFHSLWPNALHQYQAGEQVANLVSQFRSAADVLAERRPLAAAIAFDELFGELIERIDLGAGVGHGDALQCFWLASVSFGITKYYKTQAANWFGWRSGCS